MTNKEAVMKVLDLVRQTKDTAQPKTLISTPEVASVQKETHELWCLCEKIISNVAGALTVKGPVSDKDERMLDIICRHCIGVPHSDADSEFIYGDKVPMTDAEFEQWHSVLWNAMWNDEDRRFEGKTVGEMWEILIREDHFPKERFYNELDRRGLLPNRTKSGAKEEHKMKLTKSGIKPFRKFVMDHNWVSFEVPGLDGLFLRSNSTMSTGSVVYGSTLEFYKTEGNWYVSSDIPVPHQRHLNVRDAIRTFDYHPSRHDEFVRWINSYGWRVTRDNAFETDPIMIGNLRNEDSRISVHPNDTVGVFMSNTLEEEPTFEMVVLCSCSAS